MYSGTFRAPDGTKGTFYCVKSKVFCEDSDDDEDRKPVQNMFVKNDNSALQKENESLKLEIEKLKKALLQQTKAEPTKPTKPKKMITLGEYIEKTQKEIKESTRKMNELHAKYPWLLQPDYDTVDAKNVRKFKIETEKKKTVETKENLSDNEMFKCFFTN